MPTLAQDARSITLDPSEMFVLAEQRRAAGDNENAILLFTTLAKNPDIEIRTEARFRHGQLLETQKRFADAAVLYRAILDEKPDAQRVRLELAKLLALMGDMTGAQRAIRQAQAGGLPPEVAQIVDQFAGALRSFKPYGGSFEIALAPSTNINRATRATTLDTIIAPLELSEDARAKSGTGLKIGGQGYLRLPLSPKFMVTSRVSALSNLYRAHQFDDATAAGEIGAEFGLGKFRVRPSAGRSYRWYGGTLYATTNSLNVNIVRAIGKRSQIEAEGGVGWANYRANDLQDGQIYDLSLSFEHAFSARAGGRIGLSGQRQTARDPGYATAMGGGNVLFWHELGKATIFVNAGVSRLEADARLFLYPERRKEWSYRISGGATLRQYKIAGFAPVVRLSFERNLSTVGIYDYRRFAGEIAITRAF